MKNIQSLAQLGKLFLVARKRLALTQNEVDWRAGMGKQCYQYFESGNRLPSKESLDSIIRHLELDQGEEKHARYLWSIATYRIGKQLNDSCLILLRVPLSSVLSGARRSQHLSVEELALQCRTTLDEIESIENSTSWPESTLLKKWCKATQRNPRDLFEQVAFQFRELQEDILQVLLKHFQ